MLLRYITIQKTYHGHLNNGMADKYLRVSEVDVVLYCDDDLPETTCKEPEHGAGNTDCDLAAALGSECVALLAVYVQFLQTYYVQHVRYCTYYYPLYVQYILCITYACVHMHVSCMIVVLLYTL